MRYAGPIALLPVLATAAAAQTVIGPSKCITCHDHERQAAKWQREEPALFKDKAHYNARKMLEGARAEAYARAVGLADTFDLKGSCVSCHATVFRGDASAGVSCESCHGAASGYLEVHQVKGSHAKSVAAGLRELKGNVPLIAKTCVGCHVTTDKRLTAAGHPTGASFDAGASLRRIVHWTTSYDFARATGAGRAAMGSAPRAPAAVRAASPAPAGRPATPLPGAAATADAAAAVPSTTAAAPWDWNQPVRALPDDYARAEPTPRPPGAAASAAPLRLVPATLPPSRATAVARARPRPPPPRVPLSLAEDLPLGAADTPALPVAAVVPPAPRPASATARVAAARGTAVAALTRLLRQGARSPGLAAPARPQEFSGPDGELLRLQDEALALALEALRRP